MLNKRAKTKLSELRVGEQRRLLLPDLPESPELKRLKELGFIQGASVKLLHRGPLGSPLVFDICQSKLGIRKEEAAWFEVE